MTRSPTSDPRRSRLMARVRQKGTASELRVGKALRDVGVTYRLNVKSLPGSPDFANKSRKWALFVNGCFWHHHTGCRKATIPKTNISFWIDKFRSNRARDVKAIRALRERGYRVMVVWECQTSLAENMKHRLSKISESRRVDV